MGKMTCLGRAGAAGCVREEGDHRRVTCPLAPVAYTVSVMAKKWVLAAPEREAAGRLTAALHVSEVTARLLVNRGLLQPAAAQAFLQPSLHELHDPCRHPAMMEAAAFLLNAARAGKRIAIFGDYDADGICATALLMRCFAHVGAQADSYIPHRVEEGYGLSREALQELADRGTDVVVTVDCGISGADEVAFARRLGMDMVVTDHHQPGDVLPEAAYVLNPKLPGCGFGYENLAGVGVAFKLMWAIGQQLSDGLRVTEEFKDLMMEALCLVAVGTIADVVPLVDENRVLTHFGLKTLTVSSRPGLNALIAVSRLPGVRISAEDVAFRLAPRLNAAGRMGDARAAVDLLTTCDERHATDLAEHLEGQNRLRISAQNAALRQAEALLAESGQLERQGCIVLASPDWHQGIVGLVASRLAETYWRPAFVFAAEDDLLHGSGRSIPGFSLLDAVKACADLLERYGGHEGAAGLSLRAENLPAFTELVSERARGALGHEPAVPELALDGEVELGSLNLSLVKEIKLLEPFGKGNPEPLFAACDLQLVGSPRIVGSNGNHLAFMVRQDRTTLRVIAMRRADWIDELRARKGEPFALAFEPVINTYQGRTSVELRAEDLQWDADRPESP